MSNYQPSGWSLIPPVVKNLLIINVLMFLITLVFQNQYHIDLTTYLGLPYPTSVNFRPYQLITYMFMHGGWMHIIFNMYALWMFGYMLENVWGSKRFLIFYFVCGLGAAFTNWAVEAYQIHETQTAVNAYMNSPYPVSFNQLFQDHQSLLYDQSFVDELNHFLSKWNLNPDDHNLIFQSKEYAQDLVMQQANIPVIGASGAIFGVLLAFGMLFPNLELFLMFIPIPIKAKYFVIGYGLFELYAGVSGTEQGVAHFAHIGGMIFGFFLIKYWKHRPPGF